MKLLGRFIIQPVADDCYLKEAVHWIGFNQLPIAYGSIEWGEHDGRFDESAQDDLKSFPADFCVLSAMECAFAGLPADPRNDPDFEGIEGPNSYDVDDEWVRKYMPWRDPAEFVELKGLAIEFEKRKAEWDMAYEEVAQRAKEVLIPKITNGQIPLSGRRFDRRTYRTFDDVDSSDISFSDFDYEDIPAAEIQAEQIDIEQCWIRTNKDIFTHVVLPVEKLVSCFPPKAFKKQKNLSAYGDQLFVTDRTAGEVSGALLQKSPRGRKPVHPREPFIEEAVRRLAELFPDGFDPSLFRKEQFLGEMLDWYSHKFDIQPVRSWGQDRIDEAIIRLTRVS